MALTEAYQLEYNGLVIGSGTSYDVVQIVGLDDLPEIRQSDTARPSDHGLFAGSDLAGGRTIDIELEVTGATDSAFRANVNSLATATVLQSAELALTFRLPEFSGDRRIYVRPRRRSLPTDVFYQFRHGRALLQFFATDPRVYAETQTSLSTAAATSGGGRTYARTYPLTYAAGGTGGTLSAVNAGNFPTRPVLTITGPCATPRIENVTSGEFISCSLTLNTGETLTIDMDDRTVLLGGTASRYNTLVTGSVFWELDPGTNSLKFTSADSQGNLTVAFRSAWL